MLDLGRHMESVFDNGGRLISWWLPHLCSLFFLFFVSFGWVCFRDWVFDDLTIAIAENRRFSPVWKSGERSRLDGYLRAAFGEFSHVFSRELFPAVRVEVTRPPPFRKLVVRVSKVKDVID